MYINIVILVAIIFINEMFFEHISLKFHFKNYFKKLFTQT